MKKFTLVPVAVKVVESIAMPLVAEVIPVFAAGVKVADAGWFTHPASTPPVRLPARL